MDEREQSCSRIENIEDRNPVLAGAFHTDILAVVLKELGEQISQISGERREAVSSVGGDSVVVRSCDTGVNEVAVNVNAIADWINNFEHKTILSI